VVALRRLLLAHRHVAALICLAALALKLVVPSGYMFASEHGRITVTICSGVAGKTMTMEMPGMQDGHPGHGKSKEHGKEMPCAFSSLTAQALAGADPILLLIAIAFVMALGLRSPPRSVQRQTPYLRPPLRGPPSFL
jgi:hypothetical protein